jgi:hypothetical protein
MKRGISRFVTLLLVTSCGRPDDGSADDGISSQSTTMGEESADDGPVRFDIGDGEGTGGTGEAGEGDGCEKVDFVFVIDSSPSMADEQTALLASAPAFISAIQDTLMLDDFQVMVLDAGAVAGVGCDGTLGAGRVTSGTGQDCGFVGGQRYATQAHPDLPGAFSCAAARGQLGPGNEQTMDSLLAGIGPLAQAGQCNDGFVRDDAVLVVTIITDEEDDPGDINPAPAWDGTCEPADGDPNSQGDPQSWHDAIVQIKHGDPKAAVVLTLTGDCDVAGTCAGIVFDPNFPSASTGAEPAPRLRAFTQLWPFGSLGPVCTPDYAPFFEEAVSVVSHACDDFMPPG